MACMAGNRVGNAQELLIILDGHVFVFTVFSGQLQGHAGHVQGEHGHPAGGISLFEAKT